MDILEQAKVKFSISIKNMNNVTFLSKIIFGVFIVN
jgi:uncharacterized protein YlxP (DUF503 family)